MRLLFFIAGLLQSSECPADLGWVPQEANFENGAFHARGLLKSALRVTPVRGEGNRIGQKLLCDVLVTRCQLML